MTYGIKTSTSTKDFHCPGSLLEERGSEIFKQAEQISSLWLTVPWQSSVTQKVA